MTTSITLSSSTASPVDYRRTFLRWHVDHELAGTKDVLALGELRRHVETLLAQADKQAIEKLRPWLDEQVSQEQFFYDERPDYRLYVPVAVTAANDVGQAFADLTALVLWLRDQPYAVPPGVVL